jgi:3-oxoacyl-[acyl-carrier-protein] synthase III
MKSIYINAIGSYVPERILSNTDLEKMIDTSDTWIVERTGIRERRLASDTEYTHDMANIAGRQCLEGQAAAPDTVISSTCTPGKLCPNQACLVAAALNLSPHTAFDINGACTGMIYGLAIARGLMSTQPELYRYTLLTASEKMSSLTDYTDRNSCILFGDGASAMLLGHQGPGPELLHVELGADPSGTDMVVMGGPGDELFFHQDGKKVFRFGVTIIHRLLDRLGEVASPKSGQTVHIIVHQANLRMIQTVAKTRKIPAERFLTTIERYGNTSSASIGLTLAEAWRENRIHPGDLLYLIGFGGGLTWGAAALRWT